MAGSKACEVRKCKRKALSNDNNCILHSKSPHKDNRDFKIALKEIWDSGILDYAFVVFPEGEADFHNVTFAYPTKFNGAVFRGEANFSYATFLKSADFSHVTFGGLADFSYAALAADFLFSDATVAGEANFTKVTFAGKASFNETKFRRNADFNEAEFKDDAKFQNSKFKRKALFQKVTFGKSASFGNSTFGGTAEFLEATFEDEASFFEVVFSGDAIFWKAKFGRDGTFMLAKFAGRAIFNQSVFSETGMFWEAQFRQKASFAGTTIEKDALLSLATFEAEASFLECEIRGLANFQSCKFEGGVNFSRSSFEGGAQFQRATFKAGVTFIGDSGKPLFSHNRDTTRNTFCEVTLTNPGLLVFRHVDMRGCRLLHTDVRKAEFTSCTWPESPQRGIYAHDEDASPTEWGSLERLYRQLKQNHEDQRDYRRGGDFHYREKEMRRQNPDTPWGSRLVLLPLYKWLGGYGERVGRPLAWLAALTVLTTIFYFSDSLLLESPLASGKVRIGSLGSWTEWSDWNRIAIHSLKVTLFKRPSGLTPSSPLGEWVQLLHSLVGPFLLGLLALSIRQRVKR